MWVCIVEEPCLFSFTLVARCHLVIAIQSVENWQHWQFAQKWACCCYYYYIALLLLLLLQLAYYYYLHLSIYYRLNDYRICLKFINDNGQQWYWGSALQRKFVFHVESSKACSNGNTIVLCISLNFFPYVKDGSPMYGILNTVSTPSSLAFFLLTNLSFKNFCKHVENSFVGFFLKSSLRRSNSLGICQPINAN